MNLLILALILVRTEGSDLIYPTKLRENEWMGDLLNPCNAAQNAGRNGNLNVDGRHLEMKVVAGNIKARLQNCRDHLVSQLKLGKPCIFTLIYPIFSSPMNAPI